MIKMLRSPAAWARALIKRLEAVVTSVREPFCFRGNWLHALCREVRRFLT